LILFVYLGINTFRLDKGLKSQFTEMKLLANSFITPLAFGLGILALIILPRLPLIVSSLWNVILSGYFLLPLIASAVLMSLWQEIIRVMLNPLITSVTMIQNLFAVVSLSALIIVQNLAGTDFAFAAVIIIPIFLLLIVRGQENNAWNTEVKFWTRTQALFSLSPRLGIYSSEVIKDVNDWSSKMKKIIVLSKEEEEAWDALEILQTKIKNWESRPSEIQNDMIKVFEQNVKSHTKSSFMDESIALIKSYINKMICNIAISYSGDKLGSLLGLIGKTKTESSEPDCEARPLFFLPKKDLKESSHPIFKGNLVALRVDSTYLPVMIHKFEMVSGGLLSITYTPFGKNLEDRFTVYIENMKDIWENLFWIAMGGKETNESGYPQILMNAFYIASNKALHKVEYYHEELDETKAIF
jgi:hypothetical protein